MSGRRFGSRRSDIRSNRPRARDRSGVESLESRRLLATYTVTSASDGLIGGTLREAILQANATAGADTIAFNIAGTGVQTLAISGALPRITEAVTIDGTTQPGDHTRPMIRLDGASAGAAANGLTVGGSNVKILDLAIDNFGGAGIQVEAGTTTVQSCFIGVDPFGQGGNGNGGFGIFVKGTSNNVIGGGGGLGNVISGNAAGGVVLSGANASNNVIQGNFIGTDNSGGLAQGNLGDGIEVDGTGNQIGGTLPGLSNVISGNSGNGIIVSATARNTSIQSNFVGTDGSVQSGVGGQTGGGNIAIPNGGAGIAIVGASGTSIGGLRSPLPNVIAGNTGAGISIVNGGPNTVIQGNFIGTNATGTLDLGNSGAGVSIDGGDGTIIGGTIQGAGNIIAFNGKTPQTGGVSIFSGVGIPILSNSIHDNNGLGILLFNGPNQPVPNDGGDADSGPNNLQNYPIISSAATAANQTLVKGTLNSAPNTTYTVEFFANTSPNLSSYGEGEIRLGSARVTTNSQGNATFNTTLSDATAVPGQYLSATATDPNGNTSEFARDVLVTAALQSDLSVAVTSTPTPATVGAPLTYTIIVQNNGPNDATNVAFSQGFNLPLVPDSATFIHSEAPDITGTLPTSLAGVAGTLGNIPKGQSVVITVVFTPNAQGPLTTTAVVSADQIDPNGVDNTAIQTTQVVIPTNIGITFDTKRSSTSVTVGQNAVLIVNVSNFGPGVATGVIATITLPAGASYVSSSTGQGTVSFSNGVVTASLGSLSKSVTQAVRIVITAPFDAAQGAQLVATATVQANEVEPAGIDPNPNSATISIPILQSSDVSLTFAPTPEPILAGANLVYNYTITNDGPSTATNVSITDVLPASFTYVASPNPSQGTASYDPISRLLTVAIGSLAPGQSASGTLTVVPTAPGLFVNTASVTLDQPDPNPGQNTVNATTTVSPADLSVRMGATPDPVEAGRNLTYTLFVTNNGPADAANVSLVDTLPAGVTFLGASSGQGGVVQSGGTVTASLGTLTAGATVPVTIVIQPTISAVLTNTATVSSDQLDTNTANNTASVVTNVSPADVSVLVTSTGSGLAGDPVTFTALVTNLGTSTATNVTLTDQLPAGMELVSASASQGLVGTANNGVGAAIGTLPVGGSATVTIVARAGAVGSYTNTANVKADQVDPVANNNTSTAVVAVTNAPGVLQFASASFSAGENSQGAVITVVRTSGNRGPVTVDFSTLDGTGRAGSHYTPVSGTLSFADGETTKTFVVPLIDDGVVNGDTTIRLALTSPGGGATLGANSAATLTATETDFDLTGPRVLGLQPTGTGRAVTGLTLTFDEALDPARATNPGNYILVAPGRNGRGLTQVGILAPTYDSATHTVTIAASRALPLGTFFRIDVSPAVTDIFNNPLRGDSSGANGRDYVATFARGSSLRYTDSSGDLVTLNLSNGGLLDLYRSSNGDGQVLRVLGAGSRRSVLTGNVRKGGQGSDGVTTFVSIEGANFGRVDSRLTTPKFFVDNVTAFVRGSSATNVRSASALTVTSTKGRPFAKSQVHRFHR